MSRAARVIRTGGVILYVRSIEISSGESPGISGHHGIATTYSVSSLAGRCYGPQDQEAIRPLESNDIVFKLVDLAKSSLAVRLKATFRGVKTPTMIWKERKISGIESIRLLLEKG